MYEKLWSLRKQLQHSHNLIHCITNPISMNDCANAVLALGAKPIMAQHPMECEQITACSKALALNLGNFDDSRAIAMKKSLHCANENGIPVIVDMVGAGCSDLREAFAEKLLHEGKFSIIKGNLSELKAVSGRDSHALGIDVGDDDREAPAKSAEWLAELARKYGTTVLCSGEVDIAAAFLSVTETALDAALAACITFELAAEKSVSITEGPGSFHASLFDSLYEINTLDFAKARIRREL